MLHQLSEETALKAKGKRIQRYFFENNPTRQINMHSNLKLRS